MTLLITSIAAETTDDMLKRAREALERGADAVELRLDTLKSNQSVTGLAKALPTATWIATCRSNNEGGQSSEPAEHRVSTLKSVSLPGDGFVDFEYRDWKNSTLARHDLGQLSLILSYHDFAGPPDNLDTLIAEMTADPQSTVVKICWQARDIMCNFKALDILRCAEKDTVAICMGEAGLMSRVLARKFDAFGTFCALDESSPTAPGQLTLDEMKKRYRWDDIECGTPFYGVIGNPVAHSLSPRLFNDLFAANRIPGVYLPLLVEPTYECFAAFMDECLACDWLDARGFSVTLPHKEHAWRYLGDRVDPPADVMGAVNTIRIEEGEVWGCNTDAPAAVDALLFAMSADEEALEGLPIDVLGAGGVARAVVAGLVECGAEVTVFNRDAERGRVLAEQFGCHAKSWDERVSSDGKVLVNCTSVGMWPDAGASPMSTESLRSETVVFDTVYRPRRTTLLRDAERAGCVTVEGAAMFVGQAAMQFEFWTQQAADVERMARIVGDALTEAESGGDG